MEIEQHIWGMTAEGEAIVLYIMRNASGAELRLSTYGAAVVGLKVPDRKGHMEDVALGYKRFDSYFGDPAACGKTLGRWAGRIAYGHLEVGGEEYRLEINDGVNHLNGGTKGFGNRLWEGRVETNRVVMTLLSEEGDQGFPGELNAEVIFDFDDDHTLEITCLARTNRTTAVNLACNLYLNLAGEASGDILGHELRLNASQAPELDLQHLPTGRLLDITDTTQDFTRFRPLGHVIGADFNHIRDFGGLDHPFLINDCQPHILTEAGELLHPQSGRRVTVLTSQPCIAVSTGNRLAGGCPETKSGGRYADHAGVALVCQHIPDAVNRPEFPSPLLEPGELYCQKTVYRFDTID